jgi:hypothetical protein
MVVLVVDLPVCCEAALALVVLVVITTERATTVVNPGTWHGNARNQGSREDATKTRGLPVEVVVSHHHHATPIIHTRRPSGSGPRMNS